MAAQVIDWKSLIKKFHKRIPAGYVLHLAPPANADQLESAKNALPAIIPSEIFELYAACNGCSLDAGGTKYWFFVPLEGMGGLRKSTEQWFLKTHPELAGRFYPFIDWSNGDSMGYYFSETGELMSGLYCFEHENYEHDEEQDSEDFIVRWNSSIFGLLDKGAGND